MGVFELGICFCEVPSSTSIAINTITIHDSRQRKVTGTHSHKTKSNKAFQQNRRYH